MRRLTSSVQRPSLPILLSAIAVAFLASLSIFFSSPPALDASAETKNIAIIHDVDSQSFVGNEIEQFLQEFTNHNITLVQLGALADAKLAEYDLIILSPETGRQTDWGMSDSQYKEVVASGVNVLGIGQGGYSFFGKTESALGYPNGITTFNETTVESKLPDDDIFNTPFELPAKEPIQIFLETSVESKLILLDKLSDEANVYAIGTQNTNYAAIASLGCDMYWAFDGSPSQMDKIGGQLFVNTVERALTLCPTITIPVRTRIPVWTPMPSPTPPPGPTATPLSSIYAFPDRPLILTTPFAIPLADFGIHGIEITQGIQCFDTSNGLSNCPDNSLPLVLGKLTAARIYLSSEDPVDDVPVRFYILQDGEVVQTVDTVGNARPTIDQSTDDSADAIFNINGDGNTDVEFYAEVDPDNTMAEFNLISNRFPQFGTMEFTFFETEPLDIVGLRLDYDPPGYTGTNQAGGNAVNSLAAAWLNAILPLADNGINYSVASGFKDWTTSLANSDGQHDLIEEMNGEYVLSQLFSLLFTGQPLELDHYYGWAPNDGYSGGHADMPVYPHAGGLGVVGIGTDRPGVSVDNPGGGTLIFGHEIVHDYDLKHTNTGSDDCGSNDSTSVFPYATSSIQEFGYNPATQTIYNPNDTHDLMSYCPALGSTNGWTSPFTWQTMFDIYVVSPPARYAWDMEADLGIDAEAHEALHAKRSANGMTLLPTSAEKSLHIDVTIYNPETEPDVAGEFGDMYLADAGLTTWARGGNWTVELRNADGKPIHTHPFPVNFASEYSADTSDFGDPNPTKKIDLALIVEWVEGAADVALVSPTSQTVATRTVSANAPTLSVTVPVTATEWAAGTKQKVVWEAKDADGDDLTYALFYSYDAGASWQVLATDIKTQGYEVDVDSMAGGSDVRFRVIATDGLLTGSAETEFGISIPNKKPIPEIVSPASEVKIEQGELLVLKGGAVDPEDGTLPSSSLQWRSSIDGDLGKGSTVPVNKLSPGTHTIGLYATDSFNSGSLAKIVVEVAAPEEETTTFDVFLPMLGQ